MYIRRERKSDRMSLETISNLQNMYSVYLGGLPVLHKNNNGQRGRGGSKRFKQQRGKGFFSTLKRFLLPLAKRILPHAFGVAKDVAEGKPIASVLKSKAADVGAELLQEGADYATEKLKSYSKKRKAEMMEGKGNNINFETANDAPPRKKYKRSNTRQDNSFKIHWV